MGNLRSVSKALEHLGARVYVGADPRKLADAAKLLVPGVGAFGKAMEELNKRKLIEPIKRFAKSGKYILGICLGLQIFFEKSNENKNAKGFGFWKGGVVQFRPSRQKGIKVPHMGWNSVDIRAKTPLLRHVRNGSFFYFVHSFYAKPRAKKSILAESEHGVKFPAVVGADNIFAVQFHPEKSQQAGLTVLKNFIEL